MEFGAVMPAHERRQHFRVEDQIYFEYKVIEPGAYFSDQAVLEELLGKSGQRFFEATTYFNHLDSEISSLTQSLGLREPAIAHYLNILNAKIDYLARNFFLNDKIPLRKVNLSLGGMAFDTSEGIKEKSHLKIIIYTKPKMLPIILDATTVYSKPSEGKIFRTAVQFNVLNPEQEQLLSHHLMMAQVSGKAD